MRIDSTSFGTITIDGKKYDDDVWILVDGRIKQREREQNHVFEKKEMERLVKDAEVIIIGSGQSGVGRVTAEAREFLEEKGIKLMVETTPIAIKTFNKLKGEGKVAAAFHLTC